MEKITRELWANQDQHKGDRWRLFQTVGGEVDADTVFYPGSFVDIAPSFVFPSVTYLDSDRRAGRFFSDPQGVEEIIAPHTGSPPHPEFRFIHGDYTANLDLPEESFDLLVSLYAGFVSEHCTGLLRIGGVLLVNSSHGDTAMASVDHRYQLRAVVVSRSGAYRINATDLDSYLIPKSPVTITPQFLHGRGRGIAYTKSPFAYLFERVR